MHELSLCQALVSQLESIAREHDALRIASVTLGIGPLSGVEAPLLEQAFPLATMDTVADGAELRMQPIPIRVRCHGCGCESEAAVNCLVCGHCGDWHTELVSGDALLLMSVELDKETAIAADTRSTPTTGTGHV